MIYAVKEPCEGGWCYVKFFRNLDDARRVAKHDTRFRESNGGPWPLIASKVVKIAKPEAHLAYTLYRAGGSPLY